MTLKQLEAFYWAATCLNFSVAAERVHLSVSSLSKRISELETSLGTALFDRSGHGAILTEDGEQLLPKIADLLRASSDLQQSVGHHVGLQGRCRLGLGELSALTWLPKLVHKLADLHPDLVLEPHVDIGQALERRIETGELDCVVIAGPSSRSRLASEFVGQAQFVWVANEAFVAEAGTQLPQKLLADHLLVSLPEGAGGTRILDQWLAQHRVTVHRRLNCNNWGAVVGMVAAGVGFGFMPRLWAESLEQRGTLMILRKAGAMAPLQYTVQWRRDDSRQLIVEMRDLIKDVIDFTAPRALV